MPKRTISEATNDTVLVYTDVMMELYKRLLERNLDVNKENVDRLVEEYLNENGYIKAKK